MNKRVVSCGHQRALIFFNLIELGKMKLQLKLLLRYRVTLECCRLFEVTEEAGSLWTIQVDVVEILLTDPWQDKTKRILFIKRLVKSPMHGY
jgi:hypothetical protein